MRKTNNFNYSFTKIILRIIPLQFKILPKETTIFLLINAVNSISIGAGIIATKRLFDAITYASTGKLKSWDCVIPLLVMSMVTFWQNAVDGLQDFYTSYLREKSGAVIRRLLHKKLQNIEPEQFESTTFLDNLNKAKEGITPITTICFNLISLFFFEGIYFMTVGLYLFRLNPILIITLMLAFVPALVVQIVRVKVFTRLEQENAPLRRENEYYKRTLCDREYFKETRILGVFKYLYKLFNDTLYLLARRQWKTERKIALLQITFSLFTFIGMGTSTYLLFVSTMSGSITVGAFASVFSALGQIFNIMFGMFQWEIGNINTNIGKVANFLYMMDLPERTGEKCTSDFSKGIVAENVSFTYPGRNKPAVCDVSLSLARGETIAIVGENGSGKSTLVRLLIGLYRPIDGKIMIGGIDTRCAAPTSIYKGISAVFQKFQKYKMSLGENVSISNTEEEIDKLKIKEVLKQSNVDFPCDDIELDTILSPEFNGIDLSGGQWQRIAIARGLYRNNEFIVLDEPTAAIDPIEESNVYTKFKQLSQGKCSIIVTHRLGSAKLADRIVVMDGGKIVDIGTHEELVSRPGKYAEMWNAQAQWYIR